MSIKKLWRLLLLSVFLSTLLADIVCLPTFAKSNQPSKRPPPPPKVPPNKVKPGGGLNVGDRSCNKLDDSLIALVPVKNPVLTAQKHPSFLFYVPDAPQDISHAEFLLFTADEKKRIYQTSITVGSTPGIIKIDLPTSPQLALEDNQMYHWYFKIYCRDSQENPQILNVDGWVQKVSLTTEIESKIEAASPDIWYDAIAQAAEELIANPQSSKAHDRWLKLMQYINREDIADTSIPITTFKNELIDSSAEK